MANNFNARRGLFLGYDSKSFRYCWDTDNNAYISIADLKTFMTDCFVDMINEVSSDKTSVVVDQLMKYIEEGATEVYSSSLT